ncbi:hypothetical protein [Asticcacaulis sp. YBE204]|uniref:hypothetical protein n=1 Tax=Asticcacaulis sp. YBE204 TaxID=1282363 RepID=UPI0003C3FED2|nr:hypothetical protein [Asticcacaulis sp. YBE204]ESQ80419.1 hypothetical protein AEYBE204_03905 [Asticcacaulis sp. YBE204]
MTIKTALLAALALVCATSTAAQTEKSAPQKVDIEKLCATTTCRTGGIDIVLRVDEQSFTVIPVGRSPYIMEDGAILIYPGETIAIQYTVAEGKLTAPKVQTIYAPLYPMKLTKDDKVVANGADKTLPPVIREKEKAILPPNTVLFSYGQVDGSRDMMLKIESGLPETLKFDLIMATVAKGGGYRFQPTSSCPVQKVPLYEHWPHPIGPIILKNARLLASNADMVCK